MRSKTLPQQLVIVDLLVDYKKTNTKDIKSRSHSTLKKNQVGLSSIKRVKYGEKEFKP